MQSRANELSRDDVMLYFRVNRELKKELRLGHSWIIFSI